jgi:hypothetical protein
VPDSCPNLDVWGLVAARLRRTHSDVNKTELANQIRFALEQLSERRRQT